MAKRSGAYHVLQESTQKPAHDRYPSLLLWTESLHFTLSRDIHGVAEKQVSEENYSLTTTETTQIIAASNATRQCF